MHMSSWFHAALFLVWFIRRVARQAWLVGKFPAGIPVYKPGWIGYHVIAKLVFVAFKWGAEISAKWARPAHVFIARFYAFALTSPIFLSPPKPRPPPPPKHLYTPFSILNELSNSLIHVLSIQILSKTTEKNPKQKA